MPSNTFAIGDGFAKGCTSLTSFNMLEPSLIAGANCIGNDILSGTAVTSLTFPASLTNFAMLKKNALRGMDKLKELHFSGMSIGDIVDRVEKSSTMKTKY